MGWTPSTVQFPFYGGDRPSWLGELAVSPVAALQRAVTPARCPWRLVTAGRMLLLGCCSGPSLPARVPRGCRALLEGSWLGSSLPPCLCTNSIAH